MTDSTCSGNRVSSSLTVAFLGAADKVRVRAVVV
jgi:hypothetical protein